MKFKYHIVYKDGTSITKSNKTIWHVIGVLLVVAAGKAPAIVHLETITLQEEV